MGIQRNYTKKELGNELRRKYGRILPIKEIHKKDLTLRKKDEPNAQDGTFGIHLYVLNKNFIIADYIQMKLNYHNGCKKILMKKLIIKLPNIKESFYL